MQKKWRKHMPSFPKVAIIILNWNGFNDTVECLNSLKKITYPNYQIIVVDNGSDNNEYEKIKNKFGDDVKLIKNNQNLGFTGGNNTAIEQILKENNSDYILLLNNDTVVKENFLNELINYAAINKSVGIFGPKIFYWQKNIIQSMGGIINFYLGKVKNLKHYDKSQVIDYVPGCALLIKTAVIKKIGLLEEKYFAYWEEVDWCVRAKKAGYGVKVVPSAIIWHKEYASGTGDFADYQITRNKIWFMKKHASGLQYFIFNLYFWGCTIPVRIIKMQNLKIFFKAIKDGYHSL